MKQTTGRLAEFVASARQRAQALSAHRGKLEAAAKAAGKRPDFASALKQKSGLTLICEVKRSSPSQGQIASETSAISQTRLYASGGAAAISVLTEPEWFAGSLKDLAEVSEALPDMPLLRKDFIVDALQLLETRAWGASSVLLMASVLEQDELAQLLKFARALALEPLVEVHSAAELEEALAAGAGVIGVNNRNLSTLEVDLKTTLKLAEQVPAEVVLVSESGVSYPEQARMLRTAGVDAILVGTALMRAADPGAVQRALLEAGAGPGCKRKERSAQ